MSQNPIRKALLVMAVLVGVWVATPETGVSANRALSGTITSYGDRWGCNCSGPVDATCYCIVP